MSRKKRRKEKDMIILKVYESELYLQKIKKKEKEDKQTLSS